MYGSKILDLQITATAAVGKVKIIGTNGYQQIKKAVL
jgi:hypothetical protein